jgi:hypothetical protein
VRARPIEVMLAYRLRPWEQVDERGLGC